MKKMIPAFAMMMMFGFAAPAMAGSHQNPCNPCSMKHNPCDMKKMVDMKTGNPCDMKSMKKDSHKKHNPCDSGKMDKMKHNPCSM